MKPAGMRKRTREILAHAGPGGVICPAPAMLMESQKCPTEPCASFHWSPLPWNGEKCGDGIKIRKVSCQKLGTNEQVPEKRCSEIEKPVVTENCTVPCPIDCVVTPFTEWSSCPVTCLTDLSVKEYQHRQRYVLQEAQHGGMECPANLRESKPCVNVSVCSRYEWHVSTWEPCQIRHPGRKCGRGFKLREVTCLENGIKKINMTSCSQSLGKVPNMVIGCDIVCKEQCVFSDWSEFTTCIQNCDGDRRRSRSLLAGGPECKVFPREESLPCPCQNYDLVPTGEWSDCILDVDSQHDCGVGKRYRALLCVNDVTNSTAPAKECGEKDYDEEVCVVPCSADCVLSPWTQWSSCNSTSVTGVITRSRTVISESVANGRKCPGALSEKKKEREWKLCLTDLYEWQAGPWKPCDLWDSGKSDDIKTFQCGAGSQERDVWCQYRNSSFFEARVSDEYCDIRQKLENVRKCHLPCPGECLVSEWSVWTTCQQPCSMNETRSRTRKVLRQPSSRHGNCPKLEQSMLCTKDLQCEQNVKFKWSKWGPCELDGDALCGLGVESQYSQCVQSDGTVISDHLCELNGFKKTAPKRERSCYVECPVDCVVSLWSAWSPCGQQCGHVSMSIRNRSVILASKTGGRQCPELLQTKPCAYTVCYSWQVTKYSECHIEAHSCGFGEKTRQLVCQTPDGAVVPDYHCHGKFTPEVQMVSSCYQPCMGDCIVSEWSTWGHCHRPCHPQITDGIQTRSRVVLTPAYGDGHSCPESLVQTQNCTSLMCESYHWHTTQWRGDKRLVWCQRSDGLRVIGGCPEHSKPTVVRTCQPPCSIIHSYCKDVNLCACKPPYSEQRESSLLKACIMESNHTVPDPESDMQARVFPKDSWTNVWMYAVIAAGTAFIIFVAVALYTVCSGHKNGEQFTASTRYSSSAMHRRSTMTTHVQTRHHSRRTDSSIEVPTAR